MDINKSYNTICTKSVSFEGNSEQPIQTDITLPDYYPDIVRIVRSSLRTNITSVSNSQGDITAEGNAVVSILYLCEHGILHCFEQRIPFSKTIDVKENDNCEYIIDAKTEYVNCRVVNQRRIDIHASISFNCKNVCLKETNLLSACNDDSFQSDVETLKIADLKCFKAKNFSVSETIEIGSTQPTVSQIVSSNVNAVISSTKLISDKVLIKGELLVHIVYFSENEPELQHVESSIPFSQIIEAESNEQSIPFVKLDVLGYDIYAKTDSGSQLRLFELSSNIRAQLTVYDVSETPAVRDIYSTKYSINPRSNNIVLNEYNQTLEDTFLIRQSVEINDGTVQSITDISVTDININYKTEDKKIKYSGSVNVTGLISTDTNSQLSFDKQLEYEFERLVDNQSSDGYAENSVELSGISYNILSDKSLEIRAEIRVNSVLFNRREINLVSDIDIAQEKEKTVSHGITVYFADRGERLWDIAKCFNTTQKSICDMNDINLQTLDKDKSLIIIN